MRGPVSLIVAALTLGGSAARADTAGTAGQAGTATVTATATATPAAGGVERLRAGDKRELPDYDGREDEPGTLGDGLLWVPRVIFFPLYVVSEFVLRRPLEWLVITAEREQWPTLILDFFTFGEDRQFGVFPTALFDFGFRPSAGVYSFADRFLLPNNGLRLYLATGGEDWFAVRVADKITLDNGGIITVVLGAHRRPDYLFTGIGPLTDVDADARYHADKLDARLSYDLPLGDAGNMVAFAGARRVDFDEGTCCGDLSIDDQVRRGVIDRRPPGFAPDRPFALYSHGLELNFDTRRKRPAPGSGVRFEMSAEQSFDLSGHLGSPFIRYGGALGGFWDVSGKNRVVSLFAAADFIDPLENDGIVPFTELLSVGGAGAMPGFLEGTLLGRSALTARLEYRWPIWVFLDGSAHFAVGNVFGKHAQDFDWDLLRMSFGLGIRTVGRPDHAFQLLLAFGTEPFERGASVDTVRFLVGTSRGF